MAEKQSGERTEQPTQRRKRKSRESGQVAQSQELPSVVSLATLLVLLAVAGPKLFDWFRMQLIQAFSCEVGKMTDSETFMRFAGEKILGSLTVMAPFFVGLLVVGIASSIVVGGMTWSVKPLKWKLSAISPIKGVKNLFSLNVLVALLLSIAKLILIGVIVWFYMRDKAASLSSLRWVWPSQVMGAIGNPIIGLTIRICIGLLAIAIIDVAYRKWKNNKDMKMTKQEVKEERKSEEGSPEMKGKMRQLQIAMTSKRMLAEVPKADVIVVNPTHVAVALKYDLKVSQAPIVIAKGGDHMCEKIKEIGRSYGVPIIRKPKLARTIFATVKLDQPIPEALFMAVAEVLAMIHRIRQNRR